MSAEKGGDERSVREMVETRLAGACELLGSLKQEGERTRKRAKEGYGRLLDSHALVTGTIYEVLKRQHGKVGKTSESISQRLLLIGAFVQGIDLCETSITEGFYVQSSALLKQELETVAAIREVVEGKRTDGKTPNVAYAPWSLNTIYGALNDAAHVSDNDVLQTILSLEPEGDRKPVSMMPRYIPELTNRLFGVHVALLTWICWELDQLHADMYGSGLSEDDKQALLVSLSALEEAGVLTKSG